jgi:hypothetical protein
MSSGWMVRMSHPRNRRARARARARMMAMAALSTTQSSSRTSALYLPRLPARLLLMIA